MTTGIQGPISIYAVGDVLLDLEGEYGGLQHARPLLTQADIVVGNCEGVYCDRPAVAPSAKHVMVVPAVRALPLREAPFHVMTCAGNHMMDGGHVGLTDTLSSMHHMGIATCGAGENIMDAVRPAVLERGGRKIAFLAFGSVFPVGYEARPERPGINPLRIQTFYATPDPNFWEPGIPSTITTVPLPQDLDRFRVAIADARAAADRVIVCCHWGYSSAFLTIQSYELELARLAVDLGADAVLCHHQHSLRGVEIRRGRPIFFGLGTFIHHFTHFHVSPSKLAANKAAHCEYFVGPRDDFPLFPFHPDARMTGVAVLDIDDAGVHAGFIPALMRADGSTVPLSAERPEADRVFAYLKRATEAAGFGTTFQRADRDGWACIYFQNDVDG
jgi:poly-gamma-glutamate synthesis protein (capsule biosynthesis protein)